MVVNSEIYTTFLFIVNLSVSVALVTTYCLILEFFSRYSLGVVPVIFLNDI